jgi:zona occludens toxin
LIGLHIHIRVTALGRYKYQWTELGDPDSASSREVAAREKYKLPVRAFDLYKSSQLHTKIKTKLPWFVYLFAIALLSAIALGIYGYQRVTQKANPLASSHASPGRTPDNPAAGSLAEYYVTMQPRLAGLHHTAPKYDDITKPNDAPWPVGCMVSAAHSGKKEVCRCIDQQGNRYATPEATCRDIVDNGIFKDWKGPDPSPVMQQAEMGAGDTAQPGRAAPAPAVPSLES